MTNMMSRKQFRKHVQIEQLKALGRAVSSGRFQLSALPANLTPDARWHAEWRSFRMSGVPSGDTEFIARASEDTLGKVHPQKKLVEKFLVQALS